MRTAIRPEEIQIGRRADGNSVKARVVMAEYLGQTSNVTARTETGETVELRSAAPVRMNENIELSIDPAKVFLFAENGG